MSSAKVLEARQRRPLVDVAFLWAARIVSSFATIAVLAAAATHLPVDEFAEFALLVGLVAWLPVLDFGFGSVVQNRLAEGRARGLHDPAIIAACLAGAFLFAILAACAAAGGLLAWSLFGSSRLTQHPGAVLFTISCMATTGVTMIVHKVFAATGRLSMSATVSALQNLLSLAGLMLAFWCSRGTPGLLTPLFGYFVPFAFVPLVALLLVAHGAGWLVSLRGELFAALRTHRLLRDSLQFWFVLLLSLVVIQFDQFIAFSYLSPTDFAHYTVASKVISFIYFPYSALLTANWSRVSIAHAQQDRAKVLGIVHSSVLVGFGYLVVALALIVPLVGKFSHLLPRGGGQIEIGVLIGLGLVALNKVWTESYALVYLATGHTGVIARYLPIQAAVAVGMQFLLVPIWGVYGLMLGGALSYFATSHWILAWRTRDVFDNYTPAGL